MFNLFVCNRGGSIGSIRKLSQSPMSDQLSFLDECPNLSWQTSHRCFLCTIALPVFSYNAGGCKSLLCLFQKKGLRVYPISEQRLASKAVQNQAYWVVRMPHGYQLPSLSYPQTPPIVQITEPCSLHPLHPTLIMTLKWSFVPFRNVQRLTSMHVIQYCITYFLIHSH